VGALEFGHGLRSGYRPAAASAGDLPQAPFVRLALASPGSIAEGLRGGRFSNLRLVLGVPRTSCVRARQARSTRLPAHDFVDRFRELLKFQLRHGTGRVLAHRETAHHGFSHYDPLPDPRQYLLP